MIRESSTYRLEFSGVCFRQGGRSILDGVNWKIAPGEHWALLGPNGSGKTTLLRLATGYLWPSEGEIAALGGRYGEVDLRQLRRRIGWVSASLQAQMKPHLPALSVVLSGPFGSIGLYDAPSEWQRARDRELLLELGCEHLAAEPFGVLSLGEQQRVLIARALLAEPQLLILDEPCAGLDLPARERLLQSVDRLAAVDGGPTLLFVTHHIEEIPPRLTHALVLSQGRVMSAGRKADVLTSDVLTRAMGVAIDVEARHERYWPTVRP